LKIENKPLLGKHGRGSEEFREYVLTLKELKVNQSFCIDFFPSNYRVALSVCQTILGRKFGHRKEGDVYRVGRIK